MEERNKRKRRASGVYQRRKTENRWRGLRKTKESGVAGKRKRGRMNA